MFKTHVHKNQTPFSAQLSSPEFTTPQSVVLSKSWDETSTNCSVVVAGHFCIKKGSRPTHRTQCSTMKQAVNSSSSLRQGDWWQRHCHCTVWKSENQSSKCESTLLSARPGTVAANWFLFCGWWFCIFGNIGHQTLMWVGIFWLYSRKKGTICLGWIHRLLQEVCRMLQELMESCSFLRTTTLRAQWILILVFFFGTSFARCGNINSDSLPAGQIGPSARPGQFSPISLSWLIPQKSTTEEISPHSWVIQISKNNKRVSDITEGSCVFLGVFLQSTTLWVDSPLGFQLMTSDFAVRDGADVEKTQWESHCATQDWYLFSYLPDCMRRPSWRKMRVYRGGMIGYWGELNSLSNISEQIFGLATVILRNFVCKQQWGSNRSC